MKTTALIITLAASLLSLPARATPPANRGIGDDIRGELAQARHEVRRDLAQSRRELETGNLSLGDGLQFGDKRKHAKLPRAEISPAGDFLIEGKAQDITATQRRQLLAYRGLLVELGKAGIDIGERTAAATLEAVGNMSVAGMMFGAFTGGIERKVERMMQEQVEPGVRGICRRLPRVRASQQQLAASLPAFRPYATLEADGARACERDVRAEFASL